MRPSNSLKLASCLIGLALAACELPDDIDTELDLREAAALEQCSPSDAVIGLEIDDGSIEWVDQGRSITAEEVTIAVGDAPTVTLCVDFVKRDEYVQIHHGVAGDAFDVAPHASGDCVVLERAWLAEGFAPLDLDIDVISAQVGQATQLDLTHCLAPVKSSGKIKIVTTCPKYDLASN